MKGGWIRAANAVENPIADKLQRAVEIGSGALKRPDRAGKNPLPEMGILDERVLENLRAVIVDKTVRKRPRKNHAG